MAKTFNPNRVGGGTVSIVRGADGTYSLKETGFDQISSLNMIDLGAIATTTTAAATETATDKTGTTVEDQTKQAFLLPKQDKGEDPFTTEKLLKSATDVSKGLSEVETVSDRQKQESQLGATGGPTIGSFGQDPTAQIKDPTGPVFGRTPLEDDPLPEAIKVETPQDKLKLSAEEKEKRKPKFLSNVMSSIGEAIKGDKFKTEKGSEVNIDKGRGSPLGERYRSEVAQAGTTPPDAIVQGQPALGISTVPDAIKTGQPAIAPGVPDAIIQGQVAPPIATPAKRTFAQSVSTALKGVGEAVQMISPVMGIVKELGRPVGESAGAVAFNKSKFNIVTSPGAMQGRIVGDDGNYDPANNLFHGMNRTSKFGNLEKAGQKRIDRIEKTIAKKKAKGLDTSVLEKRANDFRGELDEYKQEKKEAPVTGTTKPGESGGSEATGGKSIVCTAMYQTTGLQDWAKAMKIWYIYQKRYLTTQHQEGYHKLFKPFVKAMHKSNIVKAIGAHFAKHRTQHLKHVMFNSKPSLLGKVYNKILEPICYWAGKK